MEKLRVLVIHKSEEVQRGIHNILAHYDLKFLFAADGLDGLAAAKYDRPDLIITAVKLDVLDGLSLVRMLKKETNKKCPDVIFLNDKLDYSLLCEARELNVLGFLMPPYLDNTLIYTLQRAIKRPIRHATETISFEKSLSTRVPVISQAG